MSLSHTNQSEEETSERSEQEITLINFLCEQFIMIGFGFGLLRK